MGFYLELIKTVFQTAGDDGKLRNRVVAFTSATPGEGVSYVVNLIAKELAIQTHKRVLRVDAHALREFYLADANYVARFCEETELDNLLTMSKTQVAQTARLRARPNEWDANPEYRMATIKALRWNFDYILIDCPALAEAPDAVSLAPLVDGVSVVIKAAQTRRAQIKRTQQMIESAQGRFLGFVLNQRRYPVPNWIYQRL
ncbi:MAG TPA: CpsD/CapB family tyrosine-protein kinase [Pyrinomonadaceae bacterium]|nr:CpsD/CapB family tyrosine-protein kinase [Pyrinomonadaceae bacterium]